MAEKSKTSGTDDATRTQQKVVREQQDPWPRLNFYTNHSNSFPPVTLDPQKFIQPCFLFRGQENWLARLNNVSRDKGDVINDVRQEIRALAARWLKMQNVCVLLGAGASKYVTGFVSSELYSRVSALLEKRPSAEVLRELVGYASNPATLGKGFEQLLSQLSAISSLTDTTRWPLDRLSINIPLKAGKHDSARERLEMLLVDLERAIAVLCNVPLPKSALVASDGELTPHEAFLAKLAARDPQQGRGRLFTINYDTLIEQAMDRLGIVYCDGFTGTVDRRFNPAVYDLDLHYPGEVTEGRVRRYDKVLHLYKLHGSINWRRAKPGTHNPFGVVFDPTPLPTVQDISQTPTAGGAVNADPFTRLFTNEQTLAILPTAAKYGESLTMPFAHLFRAMGQSLRESQTVLFIIGYSGWDQHINQIIEDALANPGFTCVIVDPMPSLWAQMLCKADYCGRVYCFGGHWGTFEFFAKESVPDLEVMKTELAVARTLRDLQKTRVIREDGAGTDEPRVGE